MCVCVSLPGWVLLRWQGGWVGQPQTWSGVGSSRGLESTFEARESKESINRVEPMMIVSPDPFEWGFWTFVRRSRRLWRSTCEDPWPRRIAGEGWKAGLRRRKTCSTSAWTRSKSMRGECDGRGFVTGKRRLRHGWLDYTDLSSDHIHTIEYRFLLLIR